MAFKTTVPPDAGDNGTAQQGVYVSLEQFVALQEHVALLATGYGVVGIYNFLLTDEQSLTSGWQSGLYYFKGQPKAILDVDYSSSVKLESNPPQGPICCLQFVSARRLRQADAVPASTHSSNSRRGSRRSKRTRSDEPSTPPPHMRLARS